MTTNGAYYLTKKIHLNNGKDIEIDFWDTAGQEKHRILNKIYLKDADCVMWGYDITSRKTFDCIKTFWYDYSKENSKADLIYLLGNKIDLYEYMDVEEKEARNYCKVKDIRYFEISCKNNTGIKEIFDDLTNQLIKR